MDELEVSISVLAVLALPLVGVGPMLMRIVRPRVFVALVTSCAALVLMLTREPWAAAFTLCVGVALLLGHRRGARKRSAATYVDEADSLSR